MYELVSRFINVRFDPIKLGEELFFVGFFDWLFGQFGHFGLQSDFALVPVELGANSLSRWSFGLLRFFLALGCTFAADILL